MVQLTLTIKDPTKEKFLRELFASFDYLQVEEKSATSQETTDEPYNFFDSVGRWRGRAIDAGQLRKDAWTRS